MTLDPATLAGSSTTQGLPYPTSQLRWLRTTEVVAGLVVNPHHLQQLFILADGQHEWRDVPVYNPAPQPARQKDTTEHELDPIPRQGEASAPG